jgi:ATP-dependent DNA helicase DinG
MNSVDLVFAEKGLLSLSMPGYESRPGQIEMAREVSLALENSEILLYEAPTGTGKTLAYLIPALTWGKKVVISTGTKALQEQILFKDLPLAEKILDVKVKKAVMKGRQNYLCKHRLRLFLAQPMFKTKDETDWFEQIRSWAAQTKHGDRDELSDLPDDLSFWNEINSHPHVCQGMKCIHFDDCFVTRMRRKAAEADLVIVNHHLFFADLAVGAGGHGAVIPRYSGLILDEAHQLEEIATGFFGVSLSTYRVEELMRDAGRGLTAAKITEPAFADRIRGVRAWSERFFKAFHRGVDQKYRLDAQKINDETRQSHATLIQLVKSLGADLSNHRTDDSADLLDGLIQRCNEIQKDLDILVDFDDQQHVRWCETRKKAVFLHASPIELTGTISDLLFDAAPGMILCSATLSTDGTFDFLKSRLGMPREPVEQVGPACFDYSKQAVLYVPDSMPEPNHPDFPAAVADKMEKILLAGNGRAFCLFTSYKNMYAVHELIGANLPFQVLVQGQGSKTALLDQFRENPNSVLFATASFWQGVDVVGGSLSAVLIDKIPFASPGEPVIEARIERLRANGGNPFMHYQLPEAIIALKQGLGRLIRHRSDKGVLAVFDVRLRTKPYGGKILAGMPEFPVTSNLDEVCQALERLDRELKDEEKKR